MPAPGQPYTQDETLKLIAEKAQTSVDRFKVKVFRLAGGTLPEVAGFDGATVAMLADLAAWLPGVLGGGTYNLHVYHSTDQPGMRLGGILEAKYDAAPGSPAGPPKNTPSLRVMAAAGWTGPPTLLFPNKEQIEADQLGKHPFEQNRGTPRQQLPNGLQMIQGQELPPDQNLSLQQWVARDAEIARQRELNTQKERDLNERAVRAEKELAEREAAIKRQESESKLRDEMRAANAELNSKLSAMAAAATRPQEPAGGGVKEIIAAIAPIATAFIQSNAEMRQLMLKQDSENARLARESAEKLAQMQAETAKTNAQMQMEILKGLQIKPGMSEEMKMLIENMKDSNKNSSVDAMASMMTRMVDAVGVVSKMSIGMIETIANTMGGDPEDPVVTAIKEGAKAMQMLSQGTQAGASRLIPGARPPAPTQPAPQQRPPQQQARPPQPQPQQRPQQPRPNVAVAPQPQHAPVPPAGATATGPTTPAANEGPANAFAELQPEPQLEPTQTDLVERAIRGHQDPDQVARVLVTLIAKKDQSFVSELKANNGDPSSLLASRLGEKWVGENLPYLKQLGNLFEQHGEAAGLFSEDGPAPSEGEAEVEMQPEPQPIG